MKIDYNRLADEQSLQGWRFDKLVATLAANAARQFGKCDCPDDRTCLHAAAAALHGLIRLIQHPPNCPDCQRIRERGGNEQT